MYTPDEQEYIDMRNRRRQRQQHQDRITGFQHIPQMGIDMSRMGMDVTQLSGKRKKSAPRQYGYGGTSYESEYAQEEASPPQLTEEEKKYVFDSFIDLKNTNTAVQLFTVLAVGTMSLVGLKILADMVVELSKD